MINWLKYKKIYFLISGFLVITSITSLAFWQLRPGIDFKGGTLIQLSHKSDRQIDKGSLNRVFRRQNIDIESIQSLDKAEAIVRTPYISQQKAKKLKAVLNSELGDLDLVRFEVVGPILGQELLTKTIIAAMIAVVGMLLYIAWVFKNIRFGIAAVIALLHDSLILIGSFSLLGHFKGIEVDALFVTAVLTTMSFSVHDTVVVFNNIRQKAKNKGFNKFPDVANEALTETMVRSINNSMTIIFMLAALVLLGGETVRWFMLALLIGTVLGTYSSPFVAVPILALLYRKRE